MVVLMLMMVLMATAALMVVLMMMLVSTATFMVMVVMMLMTAPTFMVMLMMMLVSTATFMVVLMFMMMFVSTVMSTAAAPISMLMVMMFMMVALLMLLLRSLVSGIDLHLSLHRPGDLDQLRDQPIRILRRQPQLLCGKRDNGLLHHLVGIELAFDLRRTVGTVQVFYDVYLLCHRSSSF